MGGLLPPEWADLSEMKKGILLIVEDDPQIRETLSEAFEAEGYLVWGAENGQDALALLGDKARGGFFPHAIILDLQMPVMDGRRFLMQFEARAEFRDIPVVIYSSDVDPAPPGYRKIRKPSDLHYLIDTIAGLTGKK